MSSRSLLFVSTPYDHSELLQLLELLVQTLRPEERTAHLKIISPVGDTTSSMLLVLFDGFTSRKSH